jgi:hypothetical protein
LSICTFSFSHCVVCSSSTNEFWLPPFGIFKPLVALEDRNHEETGYREIVTSDNNPNIANADVNYHVPCTQPETLHTAPVDTEGVSGTRTALLSFYLHITLLD